MPSVATRRATGFVVVLTGLAALDVGSLAYAEPTAAVASSTTERAPMSVVPRLQLEGLAARASTDGGLASAMITDTALTRRRGQLAASIRFPLVPIVSLTEVTFGVTDRVVVGVGGALFFAFADLDDSIGVPSLSVKVQVARGARSATSVEAGAHFWDLAGASAGTVALRHSRCVGPGCNSLLTLGLGAVQFFKFDDIYTLEAGSPNDPSVAERGHTGGVLSGSLLVGRGGTRMVAESVTLIGTPFAMTGAYAGMRVTRRRASLDVGLAAGVTFDGEPWALPLVGITVHP